MVCIVCAESERNSLQSVHRVKSVIMQNWRNTERGFSVMKICQISTFLPFCIDSKLCPGENHKDCIPSLYNPKLNIFNSILITQNENNYHPYQFHAHLYCGNFYSSYIRKIEIDQFILKKKSEVSLEHE